MPQLEDCINGETVLTSPVVCLRRSDSGALTKNKVSEKKKRKLGRGSLFLSPMPSPFLLALPSLHHCWSSGTGYFTNSNSSSFWRIDTFFWMFQYTPPPPQTIPLLHFAPALNLLEINKESCWGSGGGGGGGGSTLDLALSPSFLHISWKGT